MPLFDTFAQCLPPGLVAQSVGHLTCKSRLLGSILGLATYLDVYRGRKTTIQQQQQPMFTIHNTSLTAQQIFK